MLTSNNLRENPLKNIRQAHGLTQKQVADATGMTPGAVMKYEQGLYENPSCNLVTFYEELGHGAVEIKDDYAAWRHWKRINARVPSINNLWLGPLNVHPLTAYRKAVGYPTVLSFCVELCLHPSVVAKYEKGSSKTMPHQVKNALLEAGMNTGEIAIIQQYGADYAQNKIMVD